MKTNFTQEALENPEIAESNAIIRSCVHCGMCNATCPTYQIFADEQDGPRGRIYIMQNILEEERTPTADEVKHIDRCLSCLACMTTCPSGVHYGHLVDHARNYIEQNYQRPLGDRLIREVLAGILPYRWRFYWALRFAGIGKIALPILERIHTPFFKRVTAMLKLAPRRLYMPKAIENDVDHNRKVVVMRGCAEPVLKPEIHAATLELLNHLKIQVMPIPEEGCCGALVHHMGKSETAHEQAKANIDLWCDMIDEQGIEAILITASGCGTTVKDYGFMFRNDPDYAEKAARVSALAKDITEYLGTFEMPAPRVKRRLVIAYHSACSMQHGQKITALPKQLLEQAGYIVRDVPEGHLCCGSAGIYNIMQSEIAQQLLARKVENIESTAPDMIATGNIGCITQIASGTSIPIVHTVELLNWAYGGRSPIRAD